MILSVSLTQCYRCTSRQQIYRQCGLKHRRISTALSPTAYPDEYATTTSISDEEFLRCFQSCLPSPLWPNKIGSFSSEHSSFEAELCSSCSILWWPRLDMFAASFETNIYQNTRVKFTHGRTCHHS